MQIFIAAYDYAKGYNTRKIFHSNRFTNSYTGSCVSLWYKYKLLVSDKVQHSISLMPAISYCYITSVESDP